MKVLFLSFYLYFLGILADAQKNALERTVERRIMKGKNLSARHLVRMSDRYYALIKRFKNLEKEINTEFCLEFIQNLS